MKKTNFLKTPIYFTILTLLVLPSLTFAQQSAPLRAIPINESTLQPIQVNQTNQARGGSSSGGQGGAVATSVSTCIAASGLTGFVQNQISSVIGSVTDIFRVPTGNAVAEAKETGILGVISWDQIGWCLVNSMIESITISTVQWINNGFEGNPVFVEDPAAYFSNLADVQAGIFLNELSGGFLCGPIQNIVRINLATTYNNNISPYGDRAQCSFSAVSGSLEQFMAGETFSWNDWFSYTQVPQNNPMGATIYGQIELDRRIANFLGLEQTQLDWSGGFFSIKDKETGQITSPGAVIESQINQRLFSGQRRLEIADEFNEVVNALVNQLIRTAISEMTQY
jgi:hypothetical protein